MATKHTSDVIQHSLETGNRSINGPTKRLISSNLFFFKNDHALHCKKKITISKIVISIQMTRQMNECAEDLVESLSKEAGTGKSFDVRPYVTELVSSRTAVKSWITFYRPHSEGMFSQVSVNIFGGIPPSGQREGWLMVPPPRLGLDGGTHFLTIYAKKCFIVIATSLVWTVLNATSWWSWHFITQIFTNNEQFIIWSFDMSSYVMSHNAVKHPFERSFLQKFKLSDLTKDKKYTWLKLRFSLYPTRAKINQFVTQSQKNSSRQSKKG